MDIAWLGRNIGRAFKLCPFWTDRFKMFKWTYSHVYSNYAGAPPECNINFRLKPPVNDLKLLVRANGGSDHFIFSEIFEHYCYDINLTAPPATILDMGANCGYATIYYSRKYPDAQIACVEPIPDNCRVLKTNLVLNHIEAQVFEAAITIKDGMVEMECAHRDYGHRIAMNPAVNNSEKFLCKGLTVNSLLTSLGWTHIGLAKIDIEGYEKVLLGSDCEWLYKTHAIVIECHPGYEESDLRKLAQDYGFKQPLSYGGVWLLTR